jgi:hypothetical protein
MLQHNSQRRQQLTARAYRQFDKPLATPPPFTWSESDGEGTLSDNGLYTAPDAYNYGGQVGSWVHASASDADGLVDGHADAGSSGDTIRDY